MCKIKLFFSVFLLSLLRANCLSSGRKCIVDYSIGTCTPILECPHLLTEIVIAGTPMPAYLRSKLQQIICSNEKDEVVVCCEDPIETVDRSSSDAHETKKYIVPENEDPHSIHVSDKVYSEDMVRSKTENDRIINVQNHSNIGLLPTACGKMNDKDRIVGGNRTDLFEMPWMVVLAYQSVRGTQLSCGGTLINEWYVLTAAHCVKYLPYGLELKHVLLGEYELKHDPDCQNNNGKLICAPSIKTVAIDEVIPHRRYEKTLLTNDIALIRLSEPANFHSESIKPICLPLTQQLQKQQLVGKNAVVAGWGLTENAVQSPVLLKVSLPVISKEECQVAYEGIATIHDQQICAGGMAGQDSCSGDSGGPLLYPGKLGPGVLKYIQRGIVSFGTESCGMAGIPGVYTNVAYYMDWILDHMHS